MRRRFGTLRAGSGLRRGPARALRGGALLAVPAGAGAATITVNTTVDELGAGPRCSLREAVWSSNNDSSAQAPGCRAGSGSRHDPRPGRQLQAQPTGPDAAGDHRRGRRHLRRPRHHRRRSPSFTSGSGPGRHPATIFGERAVPRLRRRHRRPAPGADIDGGSVGAGDGGGILNQGMLTVDASTILQRQRQLRRGARQHRRLGAVAQLHRLRQLRRPGRRWHLGRRRDGQPAQRDGLRATAPARGDGAGVFVFSSGPPSQLLLADTMIAGNLDSGTRGPRLRQDRRRDHLARPEPDRQHQRLRLSAARPATSSIAAPGSSSSDDFGGPTPTVDLRRTSPAINAGAAAAREPTSAASRDDSAAAATSARWELTRCRGVVINSVGTNGPELLIGTSRADGFLALGGADTVRALGGNDGLCGGGGPDRLEGGGANDLLDGEGGRDTCLPGGGRNRLFSCELRARIW